MHAVFWITAIAFLNLSGRTLNKRIRPARTRLLNRPTAPPTVTTTCGPQAAYPPTETGYQRTSLTADFICACRADIIVVLDVSQSITEVEWGNVLDFTHDLLLNATNHICFKTALLSYGKKVNVVYGLDSSASTDAQAADLLLTQVHRLKEETANTHLALDEAAQQFLRNLAPRPDVCPVVLLFTDGGKDVKEETLESAKNLGELARARMCVVSMTDPGLSLVETLNRHLKLGLLAESTSKFSEVVFRHDFREPIHVGATFDVLDCVCRPCDGDCPCRTETLLAIESSQAVSNVELKHIKTVAMKFLDHFDPACSRSALLTWSDSVDVKYDFSSAAATNVAVANRALATIKHPRGVADSASAFSAAVGLFQNASPSLQPKTCKAMVLFSAGLNAKKNHLSEEIKNLKSAVSAKVCLVGLRDPKESLKQTATKKQELQDIVSQSDDRSEVIGYLDMSGVFDAEDLVDAIRVCVCTC